MAHNNTLRDEKRRDSFSWSSAPSALLREISKDERERAILRSRRMYETDMASDLLTAEERGEIKGELREREKWQSVVADKDAVIVDINAKLADKDAKLADKDAMLSDKDAKLADKDAEIACLRAELGKAGNR